MNHRDFLNIFRIAWDQPHVGNGLYIMSAILCHLKSIFRVQNKEVVGNLIHNLSQTEDNVSKAEANYESDPSMGNRAAYQYVRAIYISHLKNEKEFWQQKSKIKWLA